MATFATYFENLVLQNFDPYREPLAIKFAATADRTIKRFSIKYVDGFTKGLAGHLLVAIVDQLVA